MRADLTERVRSSRPSFACFSDEYGVASPTGGVEDVLRFEFERVILVGEVGEEEGERSGGRGGGGSGVGRGEGEGELVVIVSPDCPRSFVDYGEREISGCNGGKQR